MIRTRKQAPARKTLDELLAGPDELGLLDIAPPVAGAPSEEERQRTEFTELTEFVRSQKREPELDAPDIAEAILAARLQAFRADPQACERLAACDELKLLAPESREPELTAAEQVMSLDDIFSSDALGLLEISDESEAIFTGEHLPEPKAKPQPSKDNAVAQRVKCADFYRFERLFSDVAQALQTGAAQSVPFKRESQISTGDMFILNGVLCIADQVGEESIGSGKKFNPRLRVVFANGTESNLLLRSLARALYRDETGRRVLQREKSFDEFLGISHHDQQTGIIYILRSLSQDPAIAQRKNLYKIGYTTQSLEQRLAGAENQQTYLEAGVRCVASFDCYNLDPQRFERLLHAMLAHQRLNIELHSRAGGLYRPREWFEVELDTARELVKRIIDGTISHYRMDNTCGRLVAKQQAIFEDADK